MKKYWALFKVQWQAMLAYRAQILLWFLVAAFQTAFLLYLWIAVYEQGGKIGDYGFNELFTYYLLQLIIGETIAIYISWDMIEEIKYGNFSQYLLKPISYFRWQAIITASSKIREAAIMILGFIVVSFLFAKYAIGPASFAMLLNTAGLLVLGFFIAFLMEFIIGLGAFWLTNVLSLRFLIYTVARLLSGAIIPLELLPRPLFEASQFLPFQFFTYVPVQTYLGRVENIFLAYLVGAVWLVGLYIAARFFYKVSIKRYEAVGT